MVKYWQDETRSNRNEAIEGIAHSMLVLFDGMTAALPGFKIVPDPHPDDKGYALGQNENYWPDDIDIREGGDDYLHHYLYKK